jgi:hypothetical protein
LSKIKYREGIRMSKNKKRNKSITFVDEKDFSISTAQEDYYNKGLNFNYVNDIEYEVNNYGHKN